MQNSSTKLTIANWAANSKLVYPITLEGNAQQYLLQVLQRQQLVAVRIACVPGLEVEQKENTAEGWLDVG